MISIIVGKIIIAAVAVANGYVGAEWHIGRPAAVYGFSTYIYLSRFAGFPVTSRFVWGIYGQYLALFQRIVLSLVWFSVQSWTGGLCVQNILSAIFSSYQHMENHFPASAHMDTKQFIGWVIFNVLMIPILYVKPECVLKTLVYRVMQASLLR